MGKVTTRMRRALRSLARGEDRRLTDFEMSQLWKLRAARFVRFDEQLVVLTKRGKEVARG